MDSRLISKQGVSLVNASGILGHQLPQRQMRTLLANLVPQYAPFGVAADVVLRGGRRTGGHAADPGQGGEAFVELPEVADALFVFGADEPADDPARDRPRR